jgi:hypothetical protein
MRAFYIFLASLLLAFGAACSADDSSATGDAGGDVLDQPDASPPDAGSTYPAFSVDAPQVVSQGGSVLDSPKVQPVFFPGFDYATQLTDFAAKLGTSEYWAVLSEYKVGAITSATPIALTSAQIDPADIGDITDAYIQSWLKARWDGSHPEFGTAPDPSTIYALFYPPATNVYLSGGPTPDGGVPDGGGFGSQKSCTSFGGYHGDVIIGGKAIAYAVLPECPSFGGMVGVNAVSATTSHELSEAATDPFPTTAPAYGQVDLDHVAWMFFLGGGEIGDMCAQFPTSFYKDPDVGYVVQRNWSNAAAKAGHDPCQPVAGAPAYFNTMPVFGDSITTRGGALTKGIDVPVGQSKTLELDLFSDGPTSGPWAVSAQALTRNGAAPVTFDFTTTQGQNGDKLMVTVTSTGAISSKSQTATIVITSTLGGVRQSMWLGMIGQQ